MAFPSSLPPIFPRLSYQIPQCDKDQELTHHLIPSIPFNQNQNTRQRRDSHDNKLVSEIDRQEFELQQRTWLRPPGMEPYISPGYYGDQEQQEIMMPDETFLQDEDEEGFVLSEEEDGDEYEDEEELEEEEQDLDADIEEAPSDASYLSASPTNTTTPTTRSPHAQGMYEVTTPPSPGPRARTEIQAFDDLMDMMAHGRDLVLESEMNLEEREEEEEEDEGEVDLDAEVEDMDEELESSFIEGDSMEL